MTQTLPSPVGHDGFRAPSDVEGPSNLIRLRIDQHHPAAAVTPHPAHHLRRPRSREAHRIRRRRARSSPGADRWRRRTARPRRADSIEIHTEPRIEGDPRRRPAHAERLDPEGARVDPVDGSRETPSPAQTCSGSPPAAITSGSASSAEVDRLVLVALGRIEAPHVAGVRDGEPDEPASFDDPAGARRDVAQRIDLRCAVHGQDLTGPSLGGGVAGRDEHTFGASGDARRHSLRRRRVERLAGGGVEALNRLVVSVRDPTARTRERDPVRALTDRDRLVEHTRARLDPRHGVHTGNVGGPTAQEERGGTRRDHDGSDQRSQPEEPHPPSLGPDPSNASRSWCDTDGFRERGGELPARLVAILGLFRERLADHRIDLLAETQLRPARVTAPGHGPTGPPPRCPGGTEPHP